MLDEDRAFCIHFIRRTVHRSMWTDFRHFTPIPKKRTGQYRTPISLTSTGEQNLGDVAWWSRQVCTTSRKDCLSNSGKRYQSARYFEHIYRKPVWKGTTRWHRQPSSVPQSVFMTHDWIFCLWMKRTSRLMRMSWKLDFEGAVPIHNFENSSNAKFIPITVLAPILRLYQGYEFVRYFDLWRISMLMMRLMEERIRHYRIISRLQRGSGGIHQPCSCKFRDKSILDYNIKTDVHLQESWGLPNALCHRCRFTAIRIRVLWNSLRRRHFVYWGWAAGRQMKNG